MEMSVSEQCKGGMGYAGGRGGVELRSVPRRPTVWFRPGKLRKSAGLLREDLGRAGVFFPNFMRR